MALALVALGAQEFWTRQNKSEVVASPEKISQVIEEFRGLNKYERASFSAKKYLDLVEDGYFEKNAKPANEDPALKKLSLKKIKSGILTVVKKTEDLLEGDLEKDSTEKIQK